MNERVTFSRNQQVDELVAIAADLAGTDGVGAIHITVTERPTYDDLRYYHELAESNGLLLSVTANGLSLRPKAKDPEPSEDGSRGPTAILPQIRSVAANALQCAHERTSACIERLHDHVASWNAGSRV